MPPRLPPMVSGALVALPKLQPAAAAPFSTTAARSGTAKTRRKCLTWLSGKGQRFRRMPPTNTGEKGPFYLPNKLHREPGREYATEDLGKLPHCPFPENGGYVSSPVLTDKSREQIWREVMRHGKPIKVVSAEFGVDIQRVAAVVRLKEVQRQWEREEKPLATRYQDAVLKMLPTHIISTGRGSKPLEEINEVHDHPHSQAQVFWPTSESKHFTRADAARALSETLLPADKRVPHPELIDLERDLVQGKSPFDARRDFQAAVRANEIAAAEKHQAKAQLEAKHTSHIDTNRFEFRFRDFNSAEVGRDGKKRNAVGWKYGAPHYDRSRGQIKIPTSVP